MALCTFLSFLACSLGLGPCGGGRAAISIGTATGMSISSRWGFCSDTHPWQACPEQPRAPCAECHWRGEEGPWGHAPPRVVQCRGVLEKTPNSL